MKNSNNKTVLIVTTILLSNLNCCFLVGVLFAFDTYYVLVKPGKTIQSLMYLRGAIFGAFGLFSIVAINFLIRQEKFNLKTIIVNYLLIFGVIIGVICLSTKLENPLRYTRCCGLGWYSEWGYPSRLRGCLAQTRYDGREISLIPE